MNIYARTRKERLHNLVNNMGDLNGALNFYDKSTTQTEKRENESDNNNLENIDLSDEEEGNRTRVRLLPPPTKLSFSKSDSIPTDLKKRVFLCVQLGVGARRNQFIGERVQYRKVRNENESRSWETRKPMDSNITIHLSHRSCRKEKREEAGDCGKNRCR